MYKFKSIDGKIDIKSKMLILWFSELFILTILRFILARLGYNQGIFRNSLIWIVSFLPLVYFLLNISKLKIKDYLPFIFLILTVILIMLISILLNPALTKFFIREGYGIDRILRPDCAIFAFLFIYMFNDPKQLIKILIFYAYIYFVYLVILQLLPALKRGYWVDIGPNGQELKLRYNLSFGYAISFPTIVFLYESIKYKKIHSYIFFILGLWILLTQGNRGAVLIVFVYIFLLMLKNLKSSRYYLLKLIAIFSILTILYLYGNKIMIFIASQLNNLGIKSRNIDKILNGSFTDNNGRDLIWSTVIKAIKNGGILGYGMLGDRPFVFPIHYAGFSHNIFLELIVSFGIFGFFIILYLAYIIIRMLFFCRDENWLDIFIILLSCSAQLLLSMSFWYVWQFWAALAVSSKYIRLKNNN